MNRKLWRSLPGQLLILLCAVSLVLPTFGHTSGSYLPQSGTARAKRGKNGQIVEKAGPNQPVTNNRADNTSQTPNRAASQPRLPADKFPTVENSTDNNSAQNDRADSAAGDSTGPQPQPRAIRKTPPPFDRPSISSEQAIMVDPAQSGRNKSGNKSGRTTTDSQPRNDPQPDNPPVLRRNDRSMPADAPPSRTEDNVDTQDRPATRQKPVLRRPSDVEAGREREEAANRTSGGTSRDESNATVINDDEPVKLDAALVDIPVLVSDRSGRYVPQLRKEDFTIYEDGVEQNVSFFSSEEVPFHVVLLLDMSPSVANSVTDIQDAAIEFVRQLRPDDSVMVVQFDRGVQILIDFTSNRRELERAIRSASTGPGTSVYDAVYDAVARRMRNIEGRKALILFSDGEDTSSKRSRNDAIDAVSESDVLVYGLRYPSSSVNIQIGPGRRDPFPPGQIPFPFPWPRRKRFPFFNFDGMTNHALPQIGQGGGNGDFMSDVTAAGGGPVYNAERISDLSGLARRIAEELRHVYVVSYQPSNALSNGGYRQVQIRIKNHSGLAVRHRRGYSAREADGPRRK